MTNRTYKGYEIHKQTVGACGWNVSLDGKTFRGMTGFATIRDAKDWIDLQIEYAADAEFFEGDE